MTDKYEVIVQCNEDQELYIEIPEQVLSRLGWKEGDDLKFTDNKDGSFVIKRVHLTDIELEFTDEEYYTYLKAAHEAGVSFDDWVAGAMTYYIKYHDEQQ